MVLAGRSRASVELQVCKWIHGNPANLEILNFHLSDNFVTNWE